MMANAVALFTSIFGVSGQDCGAATAFPASASADSAKEENVNNIVNTIFSERLACWRKRSCDEAEEDREKSRTCKDAVVAAFIHELKLKTTKIRRAESWIGCLMMLKASENPGREHAASSRRLNTKIRCCSRCSAANIAWPGAHDRLANYDHGLRPRIVHDVVDAHAEALTGSQS
jgi:hypothetical protein